MAGWPASAASRCHERALTGNVAPRAQSFSTLLFSRADIKAVPQRGAGIFAQMQAPLVTQFDLDLPIPEAELLPDAVPQEPAWTRESLL